MERERGEREGGREREREIWRESGEGERERGREGERDVTTPPDTTVKCTNAYII